MEGNPKGSNQLHIPVLVDLPTVPGRQHQQQACLPGVVIFINRTELEDKFKKTHLLNSTKIMGIDNNNNNKIPLISDSGANFTAHYLDQDVQTRQGHRAIQAIKPSGATM